MKGDNEHLEQAALFQWASLSTVKYPELKMLFAIPNGGHRHISVAKKLKAEGVKSGIPDIFLPCAKGSYHGLWIEMKSCEGKTSVNQIIWIQNLSQYGYLAVVCYGFDEARKTIENYLSL